MRNIILIIVLFLATLPLNAQIKIDGFWITIDENKTVIEVIKQNGQHIGIRRSSNNKDYKIGELVLKDISPKGDIWEGKIYAPTRKTWYNVEITPHNDILKLKISVSFFSKTIEWKRHNLQE